MAGNNTGKFLIIIGAVVLLVGIIWYFFGDKLRWIGHLPGDINIERDSFRFYFPVTTLILLNVLIFIAIRIWNWLSR